MSAHPSFAAAPAAANASQLVMGIDIGGTKIAALVVDGHDRAVGRAEIATPRDGLGDAVISTAREALAHVPVGAGGLTAVGVAAAGHVDAAAGRVELAVNLGIRQLAIGELLHTALGVPCFVDHDSRAAAAWIHASAEAEGEHVSSLAFLNIGTGISAGIVLDGLPFRGGTGLTGEVGHVTADPSGPICACGLVGCLEAIAAGPAIERRAREAIAQGDAATVLSAGPVTAEGVLRAAVAGDPVAMAIALDVSRHVARAVRALAFTFGLERVYIGGGVVRAGEALLALVEQELECERASSALVRRILPNGFVRLVPSDADPVARGAVVIARAGLARSEEGM